MSEVDKLYNMFDQLPKRVVEFKNGQSFTSLLGSVKDNERLIFQIAKGLGLLSDLGDKLKNHDCFKQYASELYYEYQWQMEKDISNYVFSDKCKGLDLVIPFWDKHPMGWSYLNANWRLKDLKTSKKWVLYS